MEIDLNNPEIKTVLDTKAQEIAEQIAGGLKAKNTELLDEVKKLKSTYNGVDLEEYKTLKEKAKEQQFEGVKDAKELRQRLEAEYTPKLTEAQKRAEEAERGLKAYKIENELTQTLIAANIHPELLEAARMIIVGKRQVDLTDSGAVVDGLPIKQFVEKWAATDGKPYIAAPVNSGGGAKGGSGGAAKTIKRSEFDAMSQGERAKAAKDGFKIID
jgi:hypothetical protein